MAKKYNEARAVKAEKTSVAADVKVSKKTINKIKKSPVLIILVICLAIGAAGGFFAAKRLCYFRLSEFSVNGVVSEENDYATVDLSEIKEAIRRERGDDSSPITTEDIKNKLVVKSGGAECVFLGKSLDKSITRTVYYRVDKSQPYAVTDEIDYFTPGIYYEEYTSSHFAFSKSRLIRTIVVTGVEEDG